MTDGSPLFFAPQRRVRLRAPRAGPTGAVRSRRVRVDRRTDETLLAETIGDCRAGIYRLGSINGRQVRQLLRALAAAAAPTSAVAA
jgi:hypothetical protein